MTDKEMNDLAARVATKVIKAIFNVSSEVHLVFTNDEQTEPTDYVGNTVEDLDKQAIELELIRLQSLLDKYLQEEKYEKAHILKRKIQILKNKYDKNN